MRLENDLADGLFLQGRKAKFLQAHKVDAISVPEAPPSSARMNGISLAILLEKATEIETVAQYTCRDKNLLGMQADLLGAYALGLRNLLLTTGDPHQMGEEEKAALAKGYGSRLSLL